MIPTRVLVLIASVLALMLALVLAMRASSPPVAEAPPQPAPATLPQPAQAAGPATSAALERYRALVDRLPERLDHVMALDPAQADAVPALRAAAGDPHPHVRQHALTRLSQSTMPQQELIDLCMAALEDPEPNVATAAAQSLTGRRVAAERLVAAAEAIRRRPDGYGLPILAELIPTFGRSGDPAAVDFLLAELARDDDVAHNSLVITALGAAGDVRARDAVRAYRDDLLGREPTNTFIHGAWQEALDTAQAALEQLGGAAP
jgi:HEAT repeat protein